MTKAIQPGRFTAELDGDFVVFVIGMRLNKLWKVHQWFPVFLAMPPMLKELSRTPSKGLLGFWMARSGRTTVMVQYWRSFEQLEAFARNPDDPHLPAWRRFNRAIGAGGDVGIYHETYKVAAGAFETVYGNMPVFGLAAAGRSVPIGQRTDTARQRIGTDAAES
jgi:Domain of unknown function (DUF4188)